MNGTTFIVYQKLNPRGKARVRRCKFMYDRLILGMHVRVVGGKIHVILRLACIHKINDS
jgi:hypothetical protein